VINELPMFPTGPLIVKRTKEADAPKGGGVWAIPNKGSKNDSNNRALFFVKIFIIN
jgi:hypothetical protein